MKSPYESELFVLERDSGDVRHYDSRHAFQRHAEPIDIENVEYRIWNHNGREMVASVEYAATEWLHLEYLSPAPPDTLASIIGQYAIKCGFDRASLAGLSFAERLKQIASHRSPSKE